MAAANLANWAINCVKYHKIYVKVAPLMAKVKEATDTKNTAEASLAIVLAKAGGEFLKFVSCLQPAFPLPGQRN